MLHVGMDLSRHRLDVRVLEEGGATVAEMAVAPTGPELRRLAARFVLEGPVRGVIESMNGARFVHDTLELAGWDVEIADAAKVKGLAPLACKTDRIDAWVLAELSRRDLVPAIWLPDPGVRAHRERARFRFASGVASGAVEEPDPLGPDRVREHPPLERTPALRW